MAKFQFKGLEEYALKLSKLEAGSKEVAGKAIYAGADVMADEIKANIRTIPVAVGVEGNSGNKLDSITPVQRKGLEDSFGISPMRNDNGYWNVKLGFDGYNQTKTKKYPQGQPNAMIARSVESGTSFREKHPFVRPAVRRTQNAVVAEMGRVVDEEIDKIMK